MAGANVVEINQANFEATVLNSDVPVLVDFWAVWCGPCRMIAPVIDQLATANAGKYVIGKVDVDKNQSLAIQYRVSGIPALLIFNKGEMVNRFDGVTSRDVLQKALDAAA